MILRVDPRDGTARLLSIPARQQGLGRSRRWDGPHQHGDRRGRRTQNLVQTIKRNFGISIDNYVEIDFQSFRELIEVLDGVPVYFTTPVRDKNTGLFVDDPGCVMLNPDQALAYARSRHFEYKVDGRWQVDESGDLGRITRQQDFIKRSLRRASDQGVRNPGTAVGVVNAASSSVRMDDTLDVGTILTLVSEFQAFNPDSLLSEQVPTYSDPRGGVAYQSVAWDDAEPMLEAFRGVDPGAPLTPSSVIVDVAGRSSIADELDEVSARLDTAGFDAEPRTARSSRSSTTITYGPRGRDAALLVAAQLTDLPRVVLDDEIAGYRVVVNIGSDFGGVRDEALPLDQLPEDLVPPTTSSSTSTTVAPSTAPDAGQDAAAPTTTTSIPGVRADRSGAGSHLPLSDARRRHRAGATEGPGRQVQGGCR